MPSQSMAFPPVVLSLRKATLMGIVVASLTGCVQIRNQAVTLKLKVEPGSRAGTYTVSGTTSLPDRTPIIIQGLRYLRQRGSGPQDPNNFSVLARQTTRTAGGQWSATLTLSQVGPNGATQEAWQFSPQEASQVEPATEVVFTATTPPTFPTRNTEQQLDIRNRRSDDGAVVYTNDGEWYLLAQQPLPVPPPEGKVSGAQTDRAKPDLNDVEKVWGTNASVGGTDAPAKIAPVTVKEPLNTAPIEPYEMVR